MIHLPPGALILTYSGVDEYPDHEPHPSGLRNADGVRDRLSMFVPSMSNNVRPIETFQLATRRPHACTMKPRTG